MRQRPVGPALTAVDGPGRQVPVEALRVDITRGFTVEAIAFPNSEDILRITAPLEIRFQHATQFADAIVKVAARAWDLLQGTTLR